MKFNQFLDHLIEKITDRFKAVKSDINTIEEKIPAEASSSNQLADKDWVGLNGGKIDTISVEGTQITVSNKNANLTKADFGLDNVVNTGDSDTPTENGLTKFTTGGAYALKTSLENQISTLDLSVYKNQVVQELPVSDIDEHTIYEIITEVSGQDNETIQNKYLYLNHAWININSLVIDSDHKLDADLVDDSLSSNKFVSTSEKSQITTNQQSISGILDGTSLDSFSDVETALTGKIDSSTFNIIDLTSNSTSGSLTDAQYEKFSERTIVKFYTIYSLRCISHEITTGATPAEDYYYQTPMSGGLLQIHVYNHNGTCGWEALTTYYDYLINITYSDLKAQRNASKLIPGAQYRITDYACTTSTLNTSSANHLFDIIVVADSTSTLNENARAILHTGDTYFANNKLDAWQLKYCLDNDSTRFAWANTSSGKGVIYYLKDEFNNECFYDFKNILFSRNGMYTNAYTFSYKENSEMKDASITSRYCMSNLMEESVDTTSLILSFNVFVSDGINFSFLNNYLGRDCGYNTFYTQCSNNHLEDNCSSNIFTSCNFNTLARGCSNNFFGLGASQNVLSMNCNFNILGASSSRNFFGIDCDNNTLGDNNNFNSFGSYCSDITIGTDSSAIDWCQYLTFDSGCKNIYLYSTDEDAANDNQLQNIHIHEGVCGTTSTKKSIEVSDRNLSYSVDYYSNNSQEIYI